MTETGLDIQSEISKRVFKYIQFSSNVKKIEVSPESMTESGASPSGRSTCFSVSVWQNFDDPLFDIVHMPKGEKEQLIKDSLWAPCKQHQVTLESENQTYLYISATLTEMGVPQCLEETAFLDSILILSFVKDNKINIKDALTVHVATAWLNYCKNKFYIREFDSRYDHFCARQITSCSKQVIFFSLPLLTS